MSLYCIAEHLKNGTVTGLREACEAREVPVVFVDPLGGWEDAQPGEGDAVWRCSSSAAAREVEIALIGGGSLHPFTSRDRALLAIDDVPSALRAIGFPVRPALRVGRPGDRDRLRAQVTRLGGFPVTLLAGGTDGEAVLVDGFPALFSIVDYLDWCKDALWLLRGEAWHARREVYVVGGRVIGGVDSWTYSHWRRNTKPGPDDHLAVTVAEALGLRCARVVLSWDEAQRPHVVDAGFPVRLARGVVAPCSRAIVEHLVSEGLR